MSKDYHYIEIEGTCPTTGYPIDTYEHHLDPFDLSENKKEARQLTSPYGALEYAIGSGDDFHCFDFALLTSVETDKDMEPCCEAYRQASEQGPTHIALHSVLNSETGHFIQDADYILIPINIDEAIQSAYLMVDSAIDWLGNNEVRHTRAGWNQDYFYFIRSVARAVRHPAFEQRKFSERELRMGGKRLDKALGFL